MLHSIQPGKHGPFGEPMAHAVQACVHCGFCLSVCPTYAELGQEMDSPRGRIVLMKEVLEGTLTLAEAQPHVDRCLGCLACEPACPSGVPYRDLISPFRALTQSRVERSLGEKITRFITAQTIPFPARFRIATAFGRIGKMFRPLVPARLRPMLDLVPAHVPPAESWPAVTPARAIESKKTGMPRSISKRAWTSLPASGPTPSSPSFKSARVIESVPISRSRMR
jgi:glycolate oxidase iron-sulfur subunit